MSEGKSASCRLYAILARDGRSAVVFRRGPSRQVLVLRWWFDGDRIEAGQWLNGRIYERRCDLSPDGDLLIYFAAKWNTTMGTWTAVSRTPYLTALALWAKGDAWGGGGVFDGAYAIGLNHFDARLVRPGATKATIRTWHPLGGDVEQATGVVPNHFKVQPWGEHAGRGEDNPIHDHRIRRDGWSCVDRGEKGRNGDSKGFSWVLNSPEIYQRQTPVPQTKGVLLLRRILKAIGQRDGPWYVEDHEILTAEGTVLRHIPECSWADWQLNGDLLFARESCLYRLLKIHAADEVSDPLANVRLVADLGPLTFTSVYAPDWARQWP